MPRTASFHARDANMKRVTEPDMSTYLGINLDPILGPLFWGTFLLLELSVSANYFGRNSHFHGVSLDVQPTSPG